jgi:hypothetical protein
MRHESLESGAARLAGLALCVSLAIGCSPGSGSEPTYEGCASDENGRTFDDYIASARIKVDAASSPSWLQPKNGWTAPSSTPATFAWQPTPTNAGTASGDATCAKFMPQSVPGPATRSARGLVPLHEPPVSGTVYDVHFAVAGADTYRVLTTRQETTLPASVWQGFVGKHVDVTLYGAQLLRNDVVQGPFKAEPLQIFVTP